MSDKCRVGEFVTKEMKISMDWNSVRAKLASETDVQGRLAAVKHLEIQHVSLISSNLRSGHYFLLL